MGNHRISVVPAELLASEMATGNQIRFGILSQMHLFFNFIYLFDVIQHNNLVMCADNRTSRDYQTVRNDINNLIGW